MLLPFDVCYHHLWCQTDVVDLVRLRLVQREWRHIVDAILAERQRERTGITHLYSESLRMHAHSLPMRRHALGVQVIRRWHQDVVTRHTPQTTVFHLGNDCEYGDIFENDSCDVPGWWLSGRDGTCMAVTRHGHKCTRRVNQPPYMCSQHFSMLPFCGQTT